MEAYAHRIKLQSDYTLSLRLTQHTQLQGQQRNRKTEQKQAASRHADNRKAHYIWSKATALAAGAKSDDTLSLRPTQHTQQQERDKQWAQRGGQAGRKHSSTQTAGSTQTAAHRHPQPQTHSAHPAAGAKQGMVKGAKIKPAAAAAGINKAGEPRQVARWHAKGICRKANLW